MSISAPIIGLETRSIFWLLSWRNCGSRPHWPAIHIRSPAIGAHRSLVEGLGVLPSSEPKPYSRPDQRKRHCPISTWPPPDRNAWSLRCCCRTQCPCANEVCRNLVQKISGLIASSEVPFICLLLMTCGWFSNQYFKTKK